MPRFFLKFNVIMIVLLFAISACAADYTISVTLDDSTSSDLDLVVSTMNNAAKGSSASQSLRKLANGVAGEVHLLVEQRIDSNNVLTMDDGSTVALQPTDTVHTQFIAKPGAQINFSNCVFNAQSGHETCRPVYLTVQDQYGNVIRSMDLPPTKIN